jgi:hypothetical protein
MGAMRMMCRAPFNNKVLEAVVGRLLVVTKATWREREINSKDNKFYDEH